MKGENREGWGRRNDAHLEARKPLSGTKKKKKKKLAPSKEATTPPSLMLPSAAERGFFL